MYLKKKRKKLDFNIKNFMVTKKQKLAISFCEEILDIQFKGNIDNFNDVNNFLSLNL